MKDGPYLIGSSATITCFSNFTIRSITWRSSTFSGFTMSNPRPNIAVLSISSITLDLHGTMFECVVSITLQNGGDITSSASFTLNSEEIRKFLNTQFNLNIYNNIQLQFLALS